MAYIARVAESCSAGVGHWTRSQWKQSASHGCNRVYFITIIYRKANGAWLQHLLIAESALLRRAGAKPGLGVDALNPFRGPKSLQGSKECPGKENDWPFWWSRSPAVPSHLGSLPGPYRVAQALPKSSVGYRGYRGYRSYRYLRQPSVHCNTAHLSSLHQHDPDRFVHVDLITI